MNGSGWGSLTYYLAIAALSYAVRYPPILVVALVVFVFRRFIPDPWVLLGTFGRIAALKRQIEANPANATARRDLATVYLAQRRPSAALAKLEEARKRFPDDAELLFLEGCARSLRGEHAEALGPLVEAVRRDPRLRFGEPYLLAGDCLLELGRHDEAIDAFDRFLAVNSSSIEGHVKKARAHAAMGEKDAAARELDAATQLFGALPGYVRRAQLGWWLLAHVRKVIGA